MSVFCLRPFEYVLEIILSKLSLSLTYTLSLTVTIRPLSWKYLTRGMVFCLKLVRRRSMALGLSSGRPCCSARFCNLSFKRWLVQARNTTRSGVQIYQKSKDVLNITAKTSTTQINFHSQVMWPWGTSVSELQTGEPVNHLGVSLIFKFNALRSKCLNCKSHKNKDFTLSKAWRDWISVFLQQFLSTTWISLDWISATKI